MLPTKNFPSVVQVLVRVGTELTQVCGSRQMLSRSPLPVVDRVSDRVRLTKATPRALKNPASRGVVLGGG